MSRSLPLETLLSYGFNSNPKLDKLIFTSEAHQSALKASISEEQQAFMQANKVLMLGSHLGGYSEFRSVFSSNKTYVEGGGEFLQWLVSTPAPQIGVDYFIQTVRKGFEELSKPGQTTGAGVTDADLDNVFTRVYESPIIEAVDGSYVFRVFRNKSTAVSDEELQIEQIVDAIKSYQTV